MNSKLTIVITLLFAIIGCTQSPPIKEKPLPIIVFTHNIHGELEPCGCRQKPLGGLLQVAGFFEKLKSENPNREVLYFDSGDSFYPSREVPEAFAKSHQFAASELGRSYRKLNLTAFVPGDNDLAFGVINLGQLLKDNHIKMLLTNASSSNELPHETSIHFESTHAVLYFMGVLSKESLSSAQQYLVTETQDAIKNKMASLKLDHEKLFPNKKPIFIVISHSGMEQDEELAKNIPELSWIIGAHTQSFTQISRLVGKTEIVQVLSRNHYIGVIDLAKTQHPFEAIELDESFTPYSSNKVWENDFKLYQEQLKNIKKNELEHIGNIGNMDL